MDIDQDKLIAALAEGIANALTKLSQGIDKQSTLQVPTAPTSVDVDTGVPTRPESLTIPSSQPVSEQSSSDTGKFSALEPPSSLPTASSSQPIPVSELESTPSFSNLEPPKTLPPAKSQPPHKVSAADVSPVFTTLDPPTSLPPATQPQPSQAAKSESAPVFTTLEPPLSIPVATRPQPQPDVGSFQFTTFQERPPEKPVKPVEFTGPQPPETIPAPPYRPPVQPPSSLSNYETVDLRRGFSATDPGGRGVMQGEQVAEIQRYDQTSEATLDTLVQQSRVDHEYRQRDLYLKQRMLKDANDDFRRLDELERAAECSRETITDANI